ncbi:MAG: DUF4145 domain-containing protein [Bacteroidota bacterium]
MIKFYGVQPPARFDLLRPGGHCPHCKAGTRFKLVSNVNTSILLDDKIPSFVACYSCEVCLGPVPIQWTIRQWSGELPVVEDPKLVSPAREDFDFEHVPKEVRKEIEEALDCLSVNAFNGFAAVCRRAVQALCVNLGTEATTRVEKQIEEMVEVTGLGTEWRELAIQIMLSGHDGSHPHLPDVDQERAALLLSLMRDLTYQLYTRPGNIKAAATLRQAAVAAKKE